MKTFFYYIPILFFVYGFLFFLVKGWIIFKSKIGKIEDIIFKQHFCSLKNLRTGNSSAFMSTIIVNNKFLYCFTNIFSTYPFDILGLILKIELSKIETVDYCSFGNSWKKHKRIIITTKNGEKFNLLCRDLNSLYDVLSEYRNSNNLS